ncbi:MAG: ribonuclease III [Phycisphaerales bacterium]|nr:ribonuclease III [Phycisphaerales bacterium]
MNLEESARLQIEEAVGHTFRNPALIACALTHSSIATARVESNERMELLGDSVLGLVVCEHLYSRYPDAHEGDLTKIKSYLVSRLKCADYAIQAGFMSHVVLGKGLAGNAIPPSIAAATFEAMIAAAYLDGGIECARRFVMRFVEPHVDATERMGHQMNFKSVLQQVTQSMELGTPTYVVVDETGPDHAKSFEIRVAVGKRRFASSWALNKKAAEQAAALLALRELGWADGEEPNVRIIWGGQIADHQDAAVAIEAATASGLPDPSTTPSQSAE